MPRYECRIGRVEAGITTHWMLSRMALVATKLYNTALWEARRQWVETGKIPSGFDLQKVVLASSHHDYLPAHTYQHPAHQVGMAFRSWFRLRKKDPTANPPGFRKKQMLSSTLFTGYGFRLTESGTFLLTIGKKLRGEMSYPQRWLPLKVAWNTPLPADGRIVQIEITPRDGWFEIHAKMVLPEPVWKTEGQVIAVDLGMRNPIASVGEDGQVDLYKGGAILAAKRYWNKEKARVQRQVMERSSDRKRSSKPLARMAKRGGAQTKHAIHAMSTDFTQRCVERNVKEVVVGDLRGIKKGADGKGKGWADKPSQNWHQFPSRMLVAQLGYKLARHGIRLVEQDERRTSRGRCSSCGCTDRAKLHRVHRGMFLCGSCGRVQNADINGARNQLARYLHREAKEASTGSSRSLADLSVHRWDGHLWSTVVAA